MIMPALSGPYVPRFVVTGSLSKTPYLVIEWVEGESLESVLKRGLLPPPEVAHIGALIADAVYDLHLQDAIHFDLKPDNIVLRTGGGVALIDFGPVSYTHLRAHETRHDLVCR